MEELEWAKYISEKAEKLNFKPQSTNDLFAEFCKQEHPNEIDFQKITENIFMAGGNPNASLPTFSAMLTFVKCIYFDDVVNVRDSYLLTLLTYRMFRDEFYKNKVFKSDIDKAFVYYKEHEGEKDGVQLMLKSWQDFNEQITDEIYDDVVAELIATLKNIDMAFPIGYCFATKDLLENRKKIRYAYHEKPDNNQDSGWRFFQATKHKNS